MTHRSRETPFRGRWVMSAELSGCHWARECSGRRRRATAERAFWGLGLIIQPSILLSFWTQTEDERFRLSPLVSEALLSPSFFIPLLLPSPSLSLVILHPMTQNRKRSCDDYFTSMLISSFGVFSFFFFSRPFSSRKRFANHSTQSCITFLPRSLLNNH